MAQLKTIPKVGKKSLKKSVSTSMSKDDIGKCAKEYSEISKQIKLLEQRKKELADIIKAGSVKYGTLDDKGSSYLEVDGYVTGNVSRVSMSLDQDKGVEYLERRGLGDIVDLQLIKTINESRLEKAVGDKRITLEEVEKFTNRKTSYSVSVKEVEAMPEVEQSELSIAAKRR